jgi:hypothetical protein
MTQGGPERWAWPDDRSYLDQPAITVWMFETIDWAVREEMREAQKD